MLEIVIRHLKAVSMKSHKNKMSVFNLGVVFGPTLLRAAEETLAAILDIKFNNVVIEILIENYDLIFKSPPGKTTDYLQHTNASPPEPVPRQYGAYRSNRTSTNNTQPVMRVVTRANYTDTVMSSSLQNIPNGTGIYQSANKISPKNVHTIYDTKSHMNQSTPSLARDVNHLVAPTRDINIGSQPTYMTVSSASSPSANNLSSHSPIHRSGNSSLYSSGVHMDTTPQSNYVRSVIGKHSFLRFCFSHFC